MLHFRVLLHAVNLQHGTEGFTSPLKESVLRIFSPLKIRRLRQGLNPRIWVLQANTLPLDRQSRYNFVTRLQIITTHKTIALDLPCSVNFIS